MREFDLDLTPRDVQGLANADGVAAFFARLGYDTNARFVQTPENLSITSDSLTRPIRRIELIADQEAMLQVYLFELKSVTLTHTRHLAKAFRNLAGNYLLVLTGDYERIDFVLLERDLPIPKKDSPALGTRQAIIRPRVLTVDRRNPGKVEMRVLRRFTNTESVSLFQYEKLRSAFSIADWSEVNFNNRALFSDYYLTERLPDFPEWREDPKPAYLFFRDLYLNALNKYGQQKEEDLRPNLFEPIFKRLGFTWKVGKKASSDAHDQADYILMGPDGAVLAVALTYPWERSLDGKDDKRDTDTPEENPNALVVSLLERGDASWAIVTNGKVWRLYSAKTHSRATNYYEIDLEEIIAASGPGSTSVGESFRYFWLFFRASAFVLEEIRREGEPVRLNFLDRLLAESEEYAKELGERLKERVFARVFPHLAAGFIHNIREKEGQDAELEQERLDSIFQGTLTLLYRLLFLFYAESRDLLPAKETRGYFEASLSRIKREIRDVSNDIEGQAEGLISSHYKDGSYGLYERLTGLFQVVAEGDSSLNVPVYNGGLFLTKPDPADTSAEAVSARFLADHQVPDRYLALALDRMARDVDDKKHSLVFVDYKSLGVRQLGSIYEGLLEFKVRIADKKYGVAVKKKVEVYEPFSSLSDSQKRKAESTGKVVKKGEVYLENDKRERKATGSYYTPDHIVKYIVENAVGPVLAEKFEALRPGLRAAEKKRKDFMARQEGLKKAGLPPEPESKADLYEPKLLDDFFDLKVLDPAMGSGHFLVQAVDFVTDRILDFLNAFRWNPIRVFLEETRRTILEQMDQQGIDVDPKRLTDVNLLKRHVLKRCIYGVDLNPMAVELAKVSLWLDCFTLGAPLSFLDHHLRCGNSLIGVTVEEVRTALETKDGEQMPLLGSRFAGIKLAVEGMKQIGLLSDVTSAQVKESKSKYGHALSILEPYKRILDVYTSQWFGNGSVRRGQEPKALSFLKALEKDVQAFFEARGRDELIQALNALGPEDRVSAETALKSAKEKRLFHWELEFPEVFYGAREGTTQVIERLEGAGFDAVIGNPPYDVLAEKELGYDISSELNFFESASVHEPAIRGKKNLYKLFICRSVNIASSVGNISFIVPMTLLGDDQAAGIRLLLFSKTNLFIVEVFPQKDDETKRVFREAKLATVIFVTTLIPKNDAINIRTHPSKEISNNSQSLSILTNDINNFDPENLTIPSCSQKDWEIAIKILNDVKIQRIKNYCNAYQGEVNETTDGKKGFVSKQNNNAIKIIRGASICLYVTRIASQGDDIYLKKDDYLSAKQKSEKAFHFKQERVGWQESSPQNNFRRIIAAKIPIGSFCNHLINYIPENESNIPLNILLALLNSKILDWFFRLGSSNAHVSHYQIYKLPVPVISDEIKGKLSNLSAEIQKIESERNILRRSDRSTLDPKSEELQQEIDNVLFQLYGLSVSESKYIEKRLKEML